MIDGDKVRLFWEWFSARANDFGDSFQNHDLLQELDQRVNQLGNFAWEIGPGRSAPNAFVLSPGGSRDRLAETTTVVTAAPPVQDWEFYAAKPPRPWKPRFELLLEEREYMVDATAWRSVLLRYPDGAHEVVVEAPNVASLPEQYHRWAAEIAVDGLLGERRRLEAIDEVSVLSRLSDRESAAAFPIKELPERVAEAERTVGYEWLAPIVRLLGDFAETHQASTITRSAVDVLVTELLFGRRALWKAFEEGLVTQDEVLDAILDRFSNEVSRASAPSNAHWVALRSELAGWLFPPGG